MSKVLAIDPGDVQSAYVIWDGKNVIEKGKVENEELLNLIYSCEDIPMAMEMVASYGMPVGKTVFNTCVWIGRFIQAFDLIVSKNWEQIYRVDIKTHICHAASAKDSNVIQALVDRFGDTHNHGKYGKGTLKNKGFFYGFADDIWQAMAVAVYYYDKNFKDK